jgi:hypothetical protein
MSSPKIQTVEKLQHYLHVAMQLEHSTIPPYLLALYSIHPGSNLDASQVIRVVVVEEMLHLTLAANVLNAVGGKPDLTASGFVPVYPGALPDGETDFKVDLQPFSLVAVETFLKIERPGKAPSEEKRLVSRKRHGIAGLVPSPEGEDLHFYSIGEFYDEIERGLKHLHAKLGSKLFTGDLARQATSEYYYSGGGELLAVTDIDSALKALSLIIQQGEGSDPGMYTLEGELAHDFRFEQLKLGRYYEKGDKPYDSSAPDKTGPTGPELKVDWSAVYPIKKNARLSDYEKSPELHAAAVSFNQSYADFLKFLTDAYNGKPELLLQAVPRMFVLRNKINQLIHNPIPGMDGVNAAPTFEMAPATVTARGTA